MTCTFCFLRQITECPEEKLVLREDGESELSCFISVDNGTCDSWATGMGLWLK